MYSYVIGQGRRVCIVEIHEGLTRCINEQEAITEPAKDHDVLFYGRSIGYCGDKATPPTSTWTSHIFSIICAIFWSYGERRATWIHNNAIFSIVDVSYFTVSDGYNDLVPLNYDISDIMLILLV